MLHGQQGRQADGRALPLVLFLPREASVCSMDGQARPNEQGLVLGKAPDWTKRPAEPFCPAETSGRASNLWWGWKEGSQLPLTRLEASRPPLRSRAAGRAGPAAGLSDAWPVSKLTSEPSSSSDADAVFKTMDYWNNGCSPICSREMAFTSEAAWPPPSSPAADPGPGSTGPRVAQLFLSANTVTRGDIILVEESGQRPHTG